MKMNGNKSTLAVHTGGIPDEMGHGVNSPVIVSSAFGYRYPEGSRYPRYFNTPNQKGVNEKLAALELGEEGMLFSSGMAAISTVLLSLLKPGDHAVFQGEIYGGTHHLIHSKFKRWGIEFTFTTGFSPQDFEKALKPNTVLCYLESPSNPLLSIVDLKALAELCKRKKILTVIDNTFASPVLQNPIALGIDVVVHSGTKYLGGHSDLCFGAAISNSEKISLFRDSGIDYGGSLNGITTYLIERSLKTLALRVEKQSENAQSIAEFLNSHSQVQKVNYPGLKNHPGHHIAARQMKKFGGMLSFQIKDGGAARVEKMMDALQWIIPAVSLGGVESLICSPARTSHSKMDSQERAKMGVSDDLVRFSAGIEDAWDLMEDLDGALKAT